MHFFFFVTSYFVSDFTVVLNCSTRLYLFELFQLLMLVLLVLMLLLLLLGMCHKMCVDSSNYCEKKTSTNNKNNEKTKTCGPIY